MTVRVTNRNEPPIFPTTGDYSFQVAESAAVGSAVSPASAGATDPDGDTLAYSILNEDKNALEINSRTGAITIKKPEHFNFEQVAQQVRFFRIKACDAEFCVEQQCTM